MKGRPLLLAAIALAASTATAAAGEECTCRYFDQRVEIGAVACINGKLAQCLMFLNNPSWKFIGDTCPLSRNGPGPQKSVKTTVATR